MCFSIDSLPQVDQHSITSMDPVVSASVKKNIFNYGETGEQDEETKVPTYEDDDDDDAPAFGIPKTRKKVPTKDGISQQAFILK